jgi:hypothetical protein
VATNLAQARERGENVNFALADPFFSDGFHHLLAAAAQFGEVKFPLFITQLAIAPLFDAIGQVFRDMLL